MFLLINSIWLWGALNSQPASINYEADMVLPMDIPIILAGNFGELRPNHFHSGIDIKTNGKEGYNLYAIADGYVTRIKTGTTGYGKVLYINHPDLGITSVYAHCQNFVGKIGAYTILAQTQAEFYEIDIQVPATALAVKKGEIIALSGNTGSSTAPHLHFEIRETSSENPLNPLLFRFLQVADKRAPVLQQLVVFALSAKGYRIPDQRIQIPIKFKDGKYIIAKDTLEIPAHFCSEHGGIGLALAAQDQYDAADNLCGIYHGVLTVNNDTVHRQIMNRLDFETTRQINTHKDYEAYKKSRDKIDKYFRTIHNRLTIYDQALGKGIIGVQPDHFYNIQFSISDLAGNSSILAFVLRTLTGELRAENTPFDVYNKDYLYPDSSYVFSNTEYKITMPENCIYEPIKKILTYKNEKLTFGNHVEPIHLGIQLALKIPERLAKFEKQLVLYHAEGKNYFNGKSEESWFRASPKTFGTFSLDFDSIAPQLKPKFKIHTNPQDIKRLAWTVSDDKSGLVYYALYRNGNYHLLEFEAKTNELFADISKLEPGNHDFRIFVRDGVGNAREMKFSLILQ
jgi:hypothetical protein